MIFTENMCHKATRLQQNTINRYRYNLLNRSNCFQSSNFVCDPVLLWIVVTSGRAGHRYNRRTLTFSSQQTSIPSSLDSSDKWSFEQLYLWIEYFKNNSLSNNKREQLSSVQMMLVACWWSLDVGGVGSGGARERDSDGGCCRGWAGAGLVKAKGKELGQRLSCGSTQQYGAGERSCCSEGSEECLPIFLQHLTITFIKHRWMPRSGVSQLSH